MFPACCFRQRTYITEGLVNEVLNKTWTHSCLQFEGFSVGYIGIMISVFANGLGDQDSIPGWVIPKTQKMVLGTALLTTQHCKVQIKGKVEQSRERSSILSNTCVEAIEKGAFGSPSLL